MSPYEIKITRRQLHIFEIEISLCIVKKFPKIVQYSKTSEL